VCVQPLDGLHVSVVQALPSSQLSGVPAAHTPAWQVSLPLQRVASGHGVSFTTGVCWQPKVALHVSVVHGFMSSQSSGVPPLHTPAWHVSTPLQALPSEHEVPFATGVF
jgi:hypothetical protein